MLGDLVTYLIMEEKSLFFMQLLLKAFHFSTGM